MSLCSNLNRHGIMHKISMNIDNLPSYVITIDPERMKKRFRSHTSPTIFPGIKDTSNKLVGGLQSHLKLWQSLQSIYKDSDYVVIFEDDAFLCRNMTDFDKKAINIFLNEIKGNIILLGFNPYINNFTKTKYKKLLRGYALDSHAYIIKVKFATYLYDKYYNQMNSYLNKKLLPLGHVDTLLLVYETYTIYPMLYGQKDDPRYHNIFSKKGFNNETNTLAYPIYKSLNYLHHKNLLIPLTLLIFFTIIFIVLKYYKKLKIPELK